MMWWRFKAFLISFSRYSGFLVKIALILLQPFAHLIRILLIQGEQEEKLFQPLELNSNNYFLPKKNLIINKEARAISEICKFQEVKKSTNNYKPVSVFFCVNRNLSSTGLSVLQSSPETPTRKVGRHIGFLPAFPYCFGNLSQWYYLILLSFANLRCKWEQQPILPGLVAVSKWCRIYKMFPIGAK